jgi:signal transduction histidine kinase
VDSLLAVLGRSEVLQITTPEGSGPVDPLALRFGSGVTLYVPLRRGRDIIGVLAAGRRGAVEPFAPTHERIGRRLGHLASLALEAARLIENLDEANRLKSDFVSTMSHELRTPMNIILGYNDLLREDAYGPLNAEQRGVFLAMDRSARQLLALINATLDMSRLEAGRLARSISEVDPRELLAEVREESRLLESPAVKIVWKISRNLGRIRTDAVKVKVILNNLLHNAVKFTTAGQVTVEARRSRGGLDVTVKDTGIGIPQDALSLIFDAFRQAEPSSTRHYGGVGLGLYLVRRLIDMLEGSITVESEVGHGSTFHVWLRDLEDHRDKEA